MRALMIAGVALSLLACGGSGTGRRSADATSGDTSGAQTEHPCGVDPAELPEGAVCEPEGYVVYLANGDRDDCPGAPSEGAPEIGMAGIWPDRCIQTRCVADDGQTALWCYKPGKHAWDELECPDLCESDADCPPAHACGL